MKITKDWSPAKTPVHCCLFDKECRYDYKHYYMPLRLYLHFLVRKDGSRVFIPLWGERRMHEHIEIVGLVEPGSVGPRNSAEE